MGTFLCVSAVRTDDFASVLGAVTHYFTAHEVEVSTVADRTSPTMDVALFEPIDGWTTVSWPAYFNTRDTAACRWLSGELGTLISAMSIYDSDTWLHSVYRDGDLLDRFARCPAALAGTRADVARMRRTWGGDVGAVATAFGVPASAIDTFYAHLDLEDDLDEWEFTELWARLGVTYPVSADESLAVWAALAVDGGWESRLPSEG